MLSSRPQKSLTTGFTLIEVVLALAILAGAIAVLGEIMRSAGRSASDVQGETRAQLLACSLMDEVLAGVVEATDQSRAPLETEDQTPWVYSLTVAETTIQGLVSVDLTVEQDLQPEFNPVKYRLVRWAVLEDEEDSESDENESESSSEQGGGSA